MPLFGIQFFTVLCLASVEASLNSTPLIGGTELHMNLLHGEVVCHSVAVPTFANTILVEASVVGLTGNPNIFGGWDEKEITDAIQSNLAPVNSGGYHILSEYHVVPESRNSYYICVTTFATQGSDYLLTTSISDASGWTQNPVTLLDGYPVVWRLDGKGSDYVDFKMVFGDAPNTGNITVSVTPFFGEVDLKISDCEGSVLGVSSQVGSDSLSVPVRPELTNVCVRVHTNAQSSQAEFSLVASCGAPFLAQSVPIAGQAAYGGFRAFFNPDADVTILARPGIDFFADTSDGGEAWTSKEGRLELSKSALAGRNSQVLYISMIPDRDLSTALVELVLTSHSSVEQLEDGVPVFVTVEGENKFRDFRLWIPAGVGRVVVQADSSEDGSGLGLFASQVRTSHDPRGYMWNSMTGTNEIVLSVTGGVGGGVGGGAGDDIADEDSGSPPQPPQLTNCSDGCYLYISVKSCAVLAGQCHDRGLSKFVLLASTDLGVTRLVEARSVKAVWTRKEKKFQIQRPEKRTSHELDWVHVTVESAGSVDIAIGKESVTCISGPRCTVGIPHELGEEENIFFTLTSAGPISEVELVYRRDGTAQLLRNHHQVVGRVADNKEDRFVFVLPPMAENGIIDFASPDGGSLRACKVGGVACQSVTGAGVLHVNSTVALAVTSTYKLTPSFFSASNSLRIGYRPVTVSVAEKVTWQVGYYDEQEWLVRVEGMAGVEGVRMCMDKNPVECCEAPCELQGFGRQVVWVETAQSSLSAPIVTVSTESLVSLVENETVGIAGRKSSIFHLPVVPSEINSDGPVEYLDPHTARISESATFARLVTRHELFLNRMVDDLSWAFVAGGVGVVRIDRCGGSGEILTVNSEPMEGDGQDFPDLVGDVKVVSSDNTHFRIGVISGDRVGEMVVLENRVAFLAPSRAESSLYRAICGIERSQCQLERSPHTLHGEAAACVSGALCEVPLPEGCGGMTISVAAEKGVEFGVFTPVGSSWSSQPVLSSGWWNRLAWLGVLVLLARFLDANWKQVRLCVLTALVWVRSRLERPLHKSMYQELRTLEGGYRPMGADVELLPGSLTHRLGKSQSIYH